MTVVRFDTVKETPDGLHVTDKTAVEQFLETAFEETEEEISDWLEDAGIDHDFYRDEYNDVIGATTTDLTLFAEIQPADTDDIEALFSTTPIDVTIDVPLN